MAQVFGDLVERERGERGPTWAPRALDTDGSRRRAQRQLVYVSEGGRIMARAVVVLGGAYLLPHAVHRVRRGQICRVLSTPAFNRAGEPTTASEDTLVAVYEQSLDGKFGTYKQVTLSDRDRPRNLAWTLLELFDAGSAAFCTGLPRWWLACSSP